MLHFIAFNWSDLIWPLLTAAVLVFLLTPQVIRLAHRWKLMDLPSSRRVHTHPVPRLGGIALLVGILIPLFVWFQIDHRLMAVIIGATLMFTLGLLDDIYSLPPSLKLLGQICIASIVVMLGVSINNLTNPFGGIILLPPFWDYLLSLVWILLVVNTVNFLDGLDGLATGVSGIAAAILVTLSLLSFVNQPETAQLAAIVMGVTIGFLFFNWHPAKIFMGDSGSHLLGFMLAIIAIISGGKVATAVLVLGLPILDVAWAIFRRVRAGHSPFAPDKEHLHHRLLSLGLGQRGAVVIMYLAALTFGVVALISGTTFKLLYLFVALLVMWLIVKIALARTNKKI